MVRLAARRNADRIPPPGPQHKARAIRESNYTPAPARPEPVAHAEEEVHTEMSASTDAPPRKVVVGTMMYAMWGEYPGLESRLDALVGFIDRMAADARSRYDVGLDLAVLPESAVTGETLSDPGATSFPLDGTVLEAMGAAARTHHTHVIVPMTLAEDPARGLYTNSNILLDRSGNVVGNYRKVHLVADQEGGALEGGLMPGKSFPVLQCDFGKIGIQVCFDMVFDDGWETLARKGAEIVAWPSQSPQTIQPRWRARQHHYYIVSSTWRNNASVFDPTGDIIAQTVEPSSVLVEQIDLSYALIDWQPKLRNGEAFREKYGAAAGFRYSEAEDGGIFWSNDPERPIMRMVRELGLELRADSLARNLRIQDDVRGGPPAAD
jgi:predicted amidohydrolase